MSVSSPAHRDPRGWVAGRGAALANLDSFLNLGLPHGEPDPLRRPDRIRAQTRRGKAAADAPELHDVFTALGRFRHVGPPVQHLADSPREFGVAVSNVPGPREPVGVAGRRLGHLFPSAEPAEHHALRISAISCIGDHEAQLGIGLCTDPGRAHRARRPGSGDRAVTPRAGDRDALRRQASRSTT
jgi:diacylglycerol O-acyltransferase